MGSSTRAGTCTHRDARPLAQRQLRSLPSRVLSVPSAPVRYLRGRRDAHLEPPAGRVWAPAPRPSRVRRDFGHRPCRSDPRGPCYGTTPKEEAMARPQIKTNARNRPGAKTRKASRKPTKVAKPTKGAGKRRARDVSKPVVQSRPAVELAPCHFCKKDVEKAEMFCYGCEHVICNECDVSAGVYGPGHSPNDHRVEPEHVTW